MVVVIVAVVIVAVVIVAVVVVVVIVVIFSVHMTHVLWLITYARLWITKCSMGCRVEQAPFNFYESTRR